MKCKQRGCRRNALYGTQYRRPNHCLDHREVGERNATGRRCDNCLQLATVGWPHCGAIVCYAHKISGMVRQRKLSCKINACSNMAYFAKPQDIIPARCDFHIAPGDINIVFAECITCKIIAMRVYMRNQMCPRCNSKDDIASIPSDISCELCDSEPCSCSDRNTTDNEATPVPTGSMKLIKSPSTRPYTEWMDAPDLKELSALPDPLAIPTVHHEQTTYINDRVNVFPREAIRSDGLITASCWITPRPSCG